MLFKSLPPPVLMLMGVSDSRLAEEAQVAERQPVHDISLHLPGLTIIPPPTLRPREPWAGIDEQ